jgi:hypothetical protein
VTAPADKATGYGIAAAANVAARALGEAATEATQAIADLLNQLKVAVRTSPQPKYVTDARKIWDGFAAGDPLLSRVDIADLRWYAGYASALASKPAIADLADMGYEAWTNSSTLVLVGEELFAAGSNAPQLPEIFLRHEAVHIRQFKAAGDRPPDSYFEMVTFEVEAYTATVLALNLLVAAGGGGYQEARDALASLLATLQGLGMRPQRTEDQILDALVNYTYNGTRSPLLPVSSGDAPESLYVR